MLVARTLSSVLRAGGLALSLLGLGAVGEPSPETNTFIKSTSWGITLYSEPNFWGSNWTIGVPRLQQNACVDIPNTIRAKSLKKSNAFKCCVLYRARCPSKPVGDWPQIPFFLNTRVFSDIPDLEPYGFSDIVRSVVCLAQDVCNGVELDEEFSPEEGYRVTGYWLDVRDLEGRHNLVE